MKIDGKVVVVTGAAGGIGQALARRFKAEGAEGVALADLHAEPLEALAGEIGGLVVATDVTKESNIAELVRLTEAEFGPIDVFCSNAGILTLGDEDSSDADWARNWNVHVMGHVYAARAVIPGMIARGGGYLVNTASAAGLLSHMLSATYTVTKHAAVAFAEYLSIAHGDQGIRVSVLCPQAVRTPMLNGPDAEVASLDGVVEPDELAACVIETMEREDFLILPHPKVADYMAMKTGDHDRWLKGMGQMRQKFAAG